MHSLMPPPHNQSTNQNIIYFRLGNAVEALITFRSISVIPIARKGFQTLVDKPRLVKFLGLLLLAWIFVDNPDFAHFLTQFSEAFQFITNNFVK